MNNQSILQRIKKYAKNPFTWLIIAISFILLAILIVSIASKKKSCAEQNLDETTCNGRTCQPKCNKTQTFSCSENKCMCAKGFDKCASETDCCDPVQCINKVCCPNTVCNGECCGAGQGCDPKTKGCSNSCGTDAKGNEIVCNDPKNAHCFQEVFVGTPEQIKSQQARFMTTFKTYNPTINGNLGSACVPKSGGCTTKASGNFLPTTSNGIKPAMILSGEDSDIGFCATGELTKAECKDNWLNVIPGENVTDIDAWYKELADKYIQSRNTIGNWKQPTNENSPLNIVYYNSIEKGCPVPELACYQSMNQNSNFHTEYVNVPNSDSSTMGYCIGISQVTCPNNDSACQYVNQIDRGDSQPYADPAPTGGNYLWNDNGTITNKPHDYCSGLAPATTQKACASMLSGNSNIFFKQKQRAMDDTGTIITGNINIECITKDNAAKDPYNIYIETASQCPTTNFNNYWIYGGNPLANLYDLIMVGGYYTPIFFQNFTPYNMTLSYNGGSIGVISEGVFIWPTNQYVPWGQTPVIAPYQFGGIYYILDYDYPTYNHTFSVIISNPNTKEQMSQTITFHFDDGTLDNSTWCENYKSTFLNDTFKWNAETNTDTNMAVVVITNSMESPPKWGTCPN